MSSFDETPLPVTSHLTAATQPRPPRTLQELMEARLQDSAQGPGTMELEEVTEVQDIVEEELSSSSVTLFDDSAVLADFFGSAEVLSRGAQRVSPVPAPTATSEAANQLQDYQQQMNFKSERQLPPLHGQLTPAHAFTHAPIAMAPPSGPSYSSAALVQDQAEKIRQLQLDNAILARELDRLAPIKEQVQHLQDEALRRQGDSKDKAIVAQGRSQAEAEIEKLKAELEGLRTERDSMAERLEKSLSDAAAGRSELGAVKIELSSVRFELSRAQAEQERFMNEVRSLRGQMEALMKQQQDTEQRAREAEEGKRRTEEQLQSLRSELSGKGHAQTKTSDELAAAERRISQLEAEAASLRWRAAEGANIEVELSQLKRRLSLMDTELREISTENVHLRLAASAANPMLYLPPRSHIPGPWLNHGGSSMPPAHAGTSPQPPTQVTTSMAGFAQNSMPVNGVLAEDAPPGTTGASKADPSKIGSGGSNASGQPRFTQPAQAHQPAPQTHHQQPSGYSLQPAHTTPQPPPLPPQPRTFSVQSQQLQQVPSVSRPDYKDNIDNKITIPSASSGNAHTPSVVGAAIGGKPMPLAALVGVAVEGAVQLQSGSRGSSGSMGDLLSGSGGSTAVAQVPSTTSDALSSTRSIGAAPFATEKSAAALSAAFEAIDRRLTELISEKALLREESARLHQRGGKTLKERTRLTQVEMRLGELDREISATRKQLTAKPS